MAAADNQAEIVPRVVGHQYGEVHIYGTALLGDGIMTVKQEAVDNTDEHRRKALINDLDYDGSGARRDQLKLTDIGTSSFDWVKSTCLPKWLREGSTAFWISGKPGSGKSTLMRYLVDSRKTQDLLETDGEKWRILHFFYDFRLGGSTGNTPEGMLRSFLVQLLRSFPELAKHIDDRRIYQELRQGSVDVFVDILATAVRSIDVRICTFIDGLDEYDGQLWELCSHLELLRDRTGIKMCLASRPEPELVRAFESFPTIAMQDHNGASIQAYITRKVSQISVSYPNIGAAFSDRLSTSLRDKAQGVILWAKLVVDKMLDTYDDSTTEQHLLELLHTMPKELGDLYDRLLARLPDAHRGDGVLVLYLVADYRGYPDQKPLSEKVLFQAIYFIYDIQSSQNFFGQRATYENVKAHVKHVLGRLLDFVEHRENYSLSDPYMSARLIHETLATHLRRSGYSSELLPTCAAHYRGLNSWTRLALDVIHRASSGLTSGLAKLSSKMQSLLENRLDLDADKEPLDQKYLEDWRRSLSSIFLQHVETSEWRDIHDLLYVCFSGLDTLLNHGPEVMNEFFQLTQAVLWSDAMVLLLFSNELLLENMARTRVITAKTLRLWRVGRLDLAFSAALSVLPYLNEVFNRSAIEESVARDTFDTLLMSTIWSNFDDQIGDLQRFLNCPAMQDFQMDGRHICVFNDTKYISHPNALNISISQFSRPNQIWSQTHDRDCRYYGSAHTLITHWCRTPFASGVDSDAVLELLTKANVDINAKCNEDIIPIEMIFDIALLRWKLCYTLRLDPDGSSGYSLIRKVRILLDHECGPPSVEKLESALKRAERLRRYNILHHYVPAVMKDFLWGRVLPDRLASRFLSRRYQNASRQTSHVIILRSDMNDVIGILKNARMSNWAR